MKRLTVLIDADDTIENLCEVWVNFLNESMVLLFYCRTLRNGI